MNYFHILNGDALLNQFPEEISGEKIVCRECLVDGDIAGETLEELFKSRASFISDYAGCSELDYYQKTVPEICKIELINPESEIILWFEDDLFCQVNFWFVCFLLSQKNLRNSIYLVRPTEHTQFGFAGYSEEGLTILYEAKILLTSSSVLNFSQLWIAFQQRNTEIISSLYSKIESEFPFLKETISACEGMLLNNQPKVLISEIIKRKNTRHFGTIFQEFSKQHPIYGFGDLQVKRIVDDLT